MTAVTFTKNYRDRSTDSGFQFEFFCDRGSGQWMPGWLSYHFPSSCSYSYITTVQPYPVGVANKINQAASWLSSRFPQISGAGDALKSLHKEAWDNAFAAAVQEAKRHFRNCPHCNKWVCSHACFSEASGTCKTCALALGFPQAPSATESQTVTCPNCGDTTEAGKFCATCGKALAMKIFCGNCGKGIESDRRFRFCPHCGDSLAYLDDIFKEGKESA